MVMISSSETKLHLLVHLGKLRLAVGAQVLIAVAAGNLEVAVKAGQHQDLLVELRALGQCIEVARLHAAGHQIVAGTLGRGLDEGRGLDLGEVVLAESLRMICMILLRSTIGSCIDDRRRSR